MKQSAKAWLALLAVLVAAAGIARAQPTPTPAPEHPFYMHALSDPRLPRAYLERPGHHTIKRSEAESSQLSPRLHK